MKRLFNLFSIIILMLLTQVVWSYNPGFESSNPDIVMHFIQSNNAFVYLSAFFGLGILLAFTPCVLPMVPILSGIIVGQNSLSAGKAFKLSLSYVLGMAITYAGAGMLVGFMGSTIQTLMQRPSVIGLFCLIFIVMAFSMFGYFELRLPAALSGKLNGRGNSSAHRSYISVGLMGVFSTLVVSPCVTAPLIGVLSYIGQNGQILMGGLILFVMALGMGIPLLIVGSGYGTLLPKTGPWMIKIKKLFGFMMLGIALWMASRVVDKTMINLLWAALLITASISLGSLKSPQTRMGIFFQSFGVLVLMAGGVIFYNTLSFNKEAANSSVSTANPFVMVNTLSAIQNHLALAKKENKVVFLEFSADWCSDCQNMDSKVFNQSDITQAMTGFTNIKVDISDKNEETTRIKQHFGIYGIPTMFFFDAQGQQANDLNSVGLISKNEMMNLLKKAQLLS